MHIVKNVHRTGHSRGMFSAVLLGASLLASMAGAQVPTVVFGSSVGINSQAPINGNFGSGKGGYQGTTQHMAANARGDMFFHANPYGGSGYAADYLAELPYNGTALVQIVSNIGAYTSGVATDASGNIYLPDGSNSGQIDYIPLVGGVYATNVNASTLAACTLPLSGDATPCIIPFNLNGVNGYFQPKDIQIDAAGDLFIFDNNTSKIILALAPASGAANYAPQYVAAPAATAASGVTPSLAADSTGNLYYADGNAVTYYTAAALTAAYAAASSTAYASGTSVGTGLSKPQGISIDSAGNLYIGDTGNTRIVVLPLLSGSRSTANQYTLTSGVTVNAGFAVDGYGDIYYENGNSLDEITLGSLHLTSGNQYYNPSTNVTLTFTSSGTLKSSSPFTFTGSNAAAFSASTGSSTTCTAGTTYSAGGSCVLSIVFEQQNANLETAAVNAISSTGTVLGSSLLYGFPSGPGLYIDPGTVQVVGSGWTAPSSIATGNFGTVFVADSTTGNIYSSVGGAAQTTVATGFSSPSAVAVDPVGNLYVADTGNSRIVQIPYVSGAYGTQKVLATGLSGPSALSIAANGALYVADSGNGRVLILDSAAGQPLGTLAATLVTGFTTPVSLAADNYGNLYVADAGAKKLISLNLSTHTQTTILSGATTLSGVAAAPDGSVYVIDSGAKTLTKIPAPLQVLSAGSAVTIPNPVVTPSGIAADIDNNLYVIDKTGAAVVEINRSIAALNFGAIASGNNATLTATATNPGDGPLALYGINTPAAPFAEQSSSTCPTTFTTNLNAGASCTLVITYTPASGGGSSTQSLPFSSSGGQGYQTGFVNGSVLLEGNLPTITGPSSSVYASGSTYTLTTSPDGTYSVTISGTASSSASVTVSGGTGTFALPKLGVGSYTLSYTDANKNTATESITVTPAVLTVTTSGTQSRIFGQANPTFAYTITGFASGETAASATTGAPSLTTTAVPKSAAGSYTVTVAQGTLAAANYTFAETNGTFTVTGGAVQAILFPALANYTHGTTVTLAAETTSGLAVTYTVANGSGTATVSGSTLTITGAGTISVTAAQAGNSNFGAATSVTRTFTAQ